MLSISVLRNIVDINVQTIMKAFSQNDSALLPILDCDIL